MGYYVTLNASDAVLPHEHLDEAMARLLELNTHDEWKRGFASTGGVVTERWFSWMPANYDSELTTVQEILERVGYEVTIDVDGLNVEGYNNKTGCQDIFIWYISDLFREDSYMEWIGEDGAQERWNFGGGEKMTLIIGEIIWSEPAEFVPAARSVF